MNELLQAETAKANEIEELLHDSQAKHELFLTAKTKFDGALHRQQELYVEQREQKETISELEANLADAFIIAKKVDVKPLTAARTELDLISLAITRLTKTLPVFQIAALEAESDSLQAEAVVIREQALIERTNGLAAITEVVGENAGACDLEIKNSSWDKKFRHATDLMAEAAKKFEQAIALKNTLLKGDD